MNRPPHRLGREDRAVLAAEAAGARMQFAAVAVLDGAPGADRLRSLLVRRASGIPALRRRLVRGPRRPVWLDADDEAGTVDPADHVTAITCPAPGDRRTLLAAAALVVGERLSLARPPWRIVLVDGLDPVATGGRSAVVIVLHHVLADGVAGLAVLTGLLDGSGPADPNPTGPARSRTGPGPGGSAAAGGSPRRGRTRARTGSLLAAAVELLGGIGPGAPTCSLNSGPVGPRRGLAYAAAELRPLAAAARAAGGTVNDVALTAVTGALRELLAGRGEHPDRLVVSTSVSARAPGQAAGLGNRVGVRPVSLPLAGAAGARLRTIARTTRTGRPSRPGASATVWAAAVQGLTAVGAFGWFIRHQRLVNTFVTNVRGPAVPMTLAGSRIVEVIPVSPISGNVAVGFAVLGYAGRLVVTVVTDPGRCPDADLLAALVRAQLAELAQPAEPAGLPG